MDVFLCTASINNLCLISLDRYWSITQAVRYLKRRTPLRALFMIAFVWVVSALSERPPPEPAPAAADVALVASCRRRKVAKARERRAVLILGLIMVSFIRLASFLPALRHGGPLHPLHPRDCLRRRLLARYCNSAFNPIIFTIFNRDFRRAFRKILFK
ncbi:ADRA2A [Cordylochernes scorpioides]|uniref:ADRA2A n=1 Tax=Cordylochernes scorpioides TaxID=51811 RepID=A0ABY6KSN6_9ARAC|nr:ADRA2A [Cordylochernes scorpioides]